MNLLAKHRARKALQAQEAEDERQLKHRRMRGACDDARLHLTQSGFNVVEKYAYTPSYSEAQFYATFCAIVYRVTCYEGGGYSLCKL